MMECLKIERSLRPHLYYTLIEIENVSGPFMIGALNILALIGIRIRVRK